MAADLVSVIIPTWNRAAALAKAIDSVVSQTHRNWEVVVVDDGSTDDTRSMVSKLSETDPRIRYIYQANAGVSAARNCGIALAKGDFVAFLDSDDSWEPWKLELQVACLRTHPELGMVWTDMAAIGPDGAVAHPRYLKKMYSAYRRFEGKDLFSGNFPIFEVAPQFTGRFSDQYLQTGDIFSQMITGNLVHTSTVMITRERLKLVKGFNEDLKPSGEDYDFHLRTCREGQVGFLDVASIRYQIGMPDQLTHRTYGVHIAKNFLKTIEPVIRNDRQRIHLDQQVLDGTLAYAHRWLGEELLLTGSLEEARDHLATSFRQQRSTKAAGLYALSLLPVGSVPLLRKVGGPTYRIARSWLLYLGLALSSQTDGRLDL